MRAPLNVKVGVQLASGGDLALTVDVDVLALDNDDRKFVFELLDRVKAYEAGLATLRALDEMAMNAHTGHRRCRERGPHGEHCILGQGHLDNHEFEGQRMCPAREDRLLGGLIGGHAHTCKLLYDHESAANIDVGSTAVHLCPCGVNWTQTVVA